VERMITIDSVNPIAHDHSAGKSTPERTESDLDRAATKLLEANRDLRQHLNSYDYIIREGLEKYRAGMRIRDVVRTMPTADATIGSELEVIEVFEARREFRKNLTAALIADGMGVGEIALTFNTSVESICDIANELGIAIE
jgi:hypothetical protein